MGACKAKHTQINPLGDDWRCPKCDGSGEDHEFVIYESVEGSDDCEMLHEGDGLKCETCGFETTGKEYVDELIKSKNLKPCPHCKGIGLVPKDEK